MPEANVCIAASSESVPHLHLYKANEDANCRNDIEAIKSLSVNNVYGQFDFPERDDRCGKMVESEEAAFEFLIPDEQLAKAIEPAMRDLHNPPPGSLRRMPPFLVGFLSAPFNVGNVAVFFNDAQRWRAGVASIRARCLLRRSVGSGRFTTMPSRTAAS